MATRVARQSRGFMPEYARVGRAARGEALAWGVPEFLLAPDRWPRLPAPHQTFLERALPVLRADRRLMGLAAGGSLPQGGLGALSDLGLVVGTRAPSGAVD